MVTFLLWWATHTVALVLEPMPPLGYQHLPAAAECHKAALAWWDVWADTNVEEAWQRSTAWNYAVKMQDVRMHDDTRRYWRLSLVKLVGWLEFRRGLR